MPGFAGSIWASARIHERTVRLGARWRLCRVRRYDGARAHSNRPAAGRDPGRALMGNPALLLMDEPLEGLAPVIVDALLAGLERLKRADDLALLLVEQHAQLALEFSRNAIVLDRGTIVFAGKSRELLDAPET